MAVTIKYKPKDSAPSPGVWPAVSSQAAATSDQTDAFAAALSKKSKTKSPEADYPPWELAPGYSILDALKDFASNNRHGTELFLVAVGSPTRFKVLGYDPVSRRCQLESQEGLRIKPVISEREVPLYTPFWK
jgi:hypothetical protein